jgi:hypothetical protein
MIPSAPLHMKGILVVGLLFYAGPYYFIGYGATSSRLMPLTATPTPDAVVHGPPTIL